MLENHPYARKFIRVLKSRFPGLVQTVKKTLNQIRGGDVRYRFTHIYSTNAWRGAESRSGTGSSLLQTAAIRTMIPILLDDLNIKRLLDIPCGDYSWMKEVTLPIEHYVGADIVSELVHRNAATYGGPGRVFIVCDLTKDRLPPADCILCRDCLGHLSFKHIFEALNNIQRSKCTYLLTTTFSGRTRNWDIESGDWRPINLTIDPFNFPPPLKLLSERCTEDGGIWSDKNLGLWRIADLPDPLLA